MAVAIVLAAQCAALIAPNGPALIWATPLFNKKSAFAPLHSDACAAAILWNELDTSFL
jgi:hypothetical protein